MSGPGRWLSVIGIGEDGLAGLSPAARALIAQAALVVGGRRHLDLVGEIAQGETQIWPSPPQAAFPEIRARRGSAVCVLATGDPFFFGIGSLLTKEIPIDEMICLPGLSCFSLAASRLGWPLQDCALVSLHGRALETIVRRLQPRSRILALSWDGSTPGKLAQLLTGRGLGEARMIVCEALGGSREAMRTSRARDYDLQAVDALNLVALELPETAASRAAPLAVGLPDDWFEHDGQLTKREVRAVTLSALAPRPGEFLWDVGAGSGAVSIEWMLAHPANRAVAIERAPARADRIARNASVLGAPDLSIVVGAAPAALADLPRPDAGFIGGGASDPHIIDAVWSALAAGGRLVVNAVTLAGQAELIKRFESEGGDLRMIGISRVDRIGGFHALKPEREVMQWAIGKS